MNERVTAADGPQTAVGGRGRAADGQQSGAVPLQTDTIDTSRPPNTLET